MSGETQQAEGKKDNTNPLLNQDIKAIHEKLDAIGSVVGSPAVQALMTSEGQDGIKAAVVFGLRAAGKANEANKFLGKPEDKSIFAPVTNYLEKPLTGADLAVAGAVTAGTVVAYDYTAAKMGWELPRPGWFESAEEEVVSSKRR